MHCDYCNNGVQPFYEIETSDPTEVKDSGASTGRSTVFICHTCKHTVGDQAPPDDGAQEQEQAQAQQPAEPGSEVGARKAPRAGNKR